MPFVGTSLKELTIAQMHSCTQMFVAAQVHSLTKVVTTQMSTS
jgi:hypothetical protein